MANINNEIMTKMAILIILIMKIKWIMKILMKITNVSMWK